MQISVFYSSLYDDQMAFFVLGGDGAQLFQVGILISMSLIHRGCHLFFKASIKQLILSRKTRNLSMT